MSLVASFVFGVLGAGSSGVLGAGAPNGCLVVIDTVSAQLVKIEAWGTNAVRVRAVPAGGKFYDEPDIISALVPPPNATATSPECHADSLLGRQGRPLGIRSGNLRAAVGGDGTLTFTRVSDGRVLLSERSVRVLAPTITTPRVDGFLSLEMAFEAVDGERIYGLGQHAAFPWANDFPPNGQLDQKGLPPMLLEPHDGDVTIPVAHSSQGYAFLSNLPSTGAVEYNSSGAFWSHTAVLQMDIWVATTSDSPPHAVSPWQQLQAAYADATGHAPVWPHWTSGFWQCKLRYSNQSQVMAVANEYVRRHIPLALMIIDFFSWNDPGAPKRQQNTIGDETLPATCWPDPKAMVDELKEMGVELMISPYSHSVGNHSKWYPDAAAKGYLATDRDGRPAQTVGPGATYDLFNPEARAYAWNAMQAGYVSQYGLYHWWLDCSEPCGGTNNGSYATDWLYNNGKWPASFVGAAYPQMLDLTIWEGMGAPGKEFTADNVMLSRAGWAGSQRFGGAVWSGDTKSTWQDFNQQFRAGLNMVMSGIPYWTTDIGGFANGDTTSPAFRELVVRWFQWGAFCPLFRLHGIRHGPVWPAGPAGECGQEPSNEIWSFGNESEAAIIDVMRLREQLRPYVMAQYQAASDSGTPIMRPIWFDFHDDARAQLVDDQQMFGPDYLVAPVLVQGATSRFVYLPPLPTGTVWANVFTGVETDTSAGGQNISEATPLATFPLYKRHAKWTDPPTPPPPPPPLPPVTPAGGGKCTAESNMDLNGGDLAHAPAPDYSSCCAMCVKHPQCVYWTWTQIHGTPTCFLKDAFAKKMAGSPGHTSGRVGTSTVRGDL